MAKPKRKQRAVGMEGVQHPTGDKSIDRLLRTKDPSKVGHGRIITTVSEMSEIQSHLQDGFTILWCQMSKLVHGKSEEQEL